MANATTWSDQTTSTDSITRRKTMTEYRCEAECLKSTSKALLVNVDGEEMWIPKSQIHDDSEVFDDDEHSQGTLVISEWIAEQKGLL